MHIEPGFIDTEEDIPEAELQTWLSKQALDRKIGEHIQGVPCLHDMLGTRRRAERDRLKLSVAAYQRAIDICYLLSDAELLSDNRNIAPEGSNQMRPDLALLSTSGNYMLVELKTKKGAERQGVQELLAYSAAMRLQHPHVNEFIYIVIARHWDELLRFSVQALMLDGKPVLPLRCNRAGDGDFELRIVLDLFEFDTNPYYSPLYAFNPYVLAIERPRGSYDLSNRLTAYFHALAKDTADHCERIRQSGFAMVWSNPTGSRSEIISLALATVNQNWRYSEHTPSNYEFLGEKLTRLDDVLVRRAEQIRSSHLEYITEFHKREPDEFDEASANEQTFVLYVDSAEPFDIIQKFRKPTIEAQFTGKPGFGILFDGPESQCNLAAFIHELNRYSLQQAGSSRILFCPFGDLADYVETADPSGISVRPNTLYDFVRVMDRFEEHKRKKLLGHEGW